MKARVLFLLAAMGLLASCSREMIDPQESVSDGKTVVRVGLSPESRTYMDADKDAQNHHKMYWSAGDRIAINGQASAALADMAEPTSSASFTFDAALATPYKVLYPASIYTDATSVTLPAVQTYKAGGFADGMFPMAGYAAADGEVALSSLCAIVKVSILQAASDADTDNIASVRFMGRAGEQVSGLFTIDYQNAALTSASTDGADQEVGVEENLATSTGTPVEYFIVVPAGTYASGFDILVKDAEGHTMTQSKSASVTLEAGHLYNLSAFEFVPTATELGIEISSAAELIQFAQDFNARVYPSSGEGLTVTLTSDIAFDATTSAAFNATGGIGNKDGDGDNYFSGTFDGGNHTISGLKATVPLFAYTGSSAAVSNLSMADDCSLTVNASAPDTNHAPLVGRNKGSITNCSSLAAVVINNLGDITSGAHHYGALVGRNYGGAISDCVAGGDITCAQSGVTITANAVYIGGISGSQANTGSVKNCDYTGSISVSDGSDYGGITASKIYFYVGGIVGYADDGEISHCNASSESATASIQVRGTLVPAIGGIVGWVKLTEGSSISECKNYMALSFKSSGARANTTPCRIGGIAARSAATISDSQNYGAIASNCNSTTLYLAGIVCDGANVSGCTNNSTGTVTRSNADQTADQANRYIYISGIMATNHVAGAAVDHCANYALIKNNTPGTATNTTIDMGGIFGGAQNQVNSADNQISITDCENHGNVTATETTNAVATARVALGGIIGYCGAPNSSIVNCQNFNQIYCQYNSSATINGRRSYIGGIAGIMANFASSSSITGLEGLEIDGCTNTGAIWSRNYNNSSTLTTGAFGGGIVGAIIGTDESKASVHDCESSTGLITNYRGIVAGIAAYAGASTLKDNAASNASTANNNAEGFGGIAGTLVGSSMSGCTFSGEVNASGGSAPKNVGGLAYSIDGTSSISNCQVDGASLIKGTNADATDPAVLASKASEGATITGCGVKGTLDGEAITLASTMITADEGATVSGTYLLP